MRTLVNLSMALGLAISGPALGISETPTETVETIVANEHVTNVTPTAKFNKFVYDSKLPVIIDFFHPYCGACVASKEPFAELAEAYDGKMKFGEVNIEKNRKLSETMKVEYVPTFIIFQNGKEKFKMVGFPDSEEFKKQINEAYKALSE